MEKIKTGKNIIKTFFKTDDGKPFIATDTQAEFFMDIFTLEYPRLAFLGITRFGKTDITAMGILLRSLTYKEHFTIAANTKDLCKVLMDKCILHLSDNDIFEKNLVLHDKALTKKMQKKESKSEFTWINGGGIKSITLSSSLNKAEVESALGEGTNRLILEEASAIPNNVVGQAIRMLGDNVEDSFLLKLGNALYLNHFSDSIRDKNYKSYTVDWKQAKKEGRVSDEFVEEMKGTMTKRQFEAMYLCKFPDKEEQDRHGYFYLFKDDDFKEPLKHIGKKVLGFDVSQGEDKNVGIVRSETFAEVQHKANLKDTMQQVIVIDRLAKKNKIDYERVMIDATGVGAGVVDRLEEDDKQVVGVKWGASAKDNKTFANCKAEQFFEAQRWIADGGTIDDEDLEKELLLIKWKQTSNGKIQIKSKKEYASEGIASTDIADAFALTFADMNKEIDIDIEFI